MKDGYTKDKYEIRSTKSETNSKSKILNAQNEIASSAIGGLAMTNFRIDSSASLGMALVIADSK
ncbi:MAG: hypothetical protein FVQ85_03455 [Planctomycetes bacterium]|nr:hypothetical protein [Planctomycetota bacterium]